MYGRTVEPVAASPVAPEPERLVDVPATLVGWLLIRVAC